MLIQLLNYYLILFNVEKDLSTAEIGIDWAFILSTIRWFNFNSIGIVIGR